MNSLGNILKLTTSGESHGVGLAGILDGLPSGIPFSEDDLNHWLSLRKPGQSRITTQRKESDTAQVLAGVFEGKTTGTPISWVIFNEQQRSKDYSEIQDKYRPSHADYTYDKKYGFRDYRGGGRSSARETVNWVAGGYFALQFLQSLGVQVEAWVSQVHTLEIPLLYGQLDIKNRYQFPTRVPNPEWDERIFNYIDGIRKEGDTVGGIIQCKVSGLPIGIGEPVFAKLHAELAHAMMSINAAKGFDYGAGFACIEKKGSELNDAFQSSSDGTVTTKTNYSGGIQGGISNGMDIDFRVAFKPVATIMQSQDTIDQSGNEVELKAKGRHDPCVLPRAVPIVESMAALVIADAILLQKRFNKD